MERKETELYEKVTSLVCNIIIKYGYPGGSNPIMMLICLVVHMVRYQTPLSSSKGPQLRWLIKDIFFFI